MSPSGPDTGPTVEQISRIDALEEASDIYRDVRAQMVGADDVRYASLAEKALAALNRIEQIEKNRPRVPTRDEVTARLVDVREKAIDRIGLLTSAAAVKLAADRAAFAAWCAGLGPVGDEALRRVNAMLEPPKQP